MEGIELIIAVIGAVIILCLYTWLNYPANVG